MKVVLIAIRRPNHAICQLCNEDTAFFTWVALKAQSRKIYCFTKRTRKLYTLQGDQIASFRVFCLVMCSSNIAMKSRPPFDLFPEVTLQSSAAVRWWSFRPRLHWNWSTALLLSHRVQQVHERLRSTSYSAKAIIQSCQQYRVVK